MFETVLVWFNIFIHDRGAEGKKFKSPKHFTVLLSFLLTSAYKPQPMKINIFFWKISGTTGFRPTIVLLRANQKNHIFSCPRVLPGDPPLTEEPENAGLEIAAYQDGSGLGQENFFAPTNYQDEAKPFGMVLGFSEIVEYKVHLWNILFMF